MANLINDHLMNLTSKTIALGGIENPLTRTIAAGTTIYRFGGNQDQAAIGSWWFGQDQYFQMEDFALLNKLSFAYAARILTAVLHEYNEFTHLAKAKTLVDLRAYHGESLPQRGKIVTVSKKPGASQTKQRFGDFIGRPTASLTQKFQQLFIPGLHDPKINADALGAAIIVKIIPSKESHMFGTKGAPEGALLQ